MLADSKLSQLKDWLTIDEAVEKLSTELKEKISKADIYKLALDRRLILSAYFPNGATVRLGKLINYNLADKKEVINLDGNGTVILSKAIPIDDFFHEFSFPPALIFEDEINTIQDESIWDLAMIGNEYHDIKYFYLREISGLENTLINFEGTFLRSGNIWLGLQTPFEPKKLKEGYYPSGSLNDFDYVLVVKQRAIKNLIDFLNKNQSLGSDKYGVSESEVFRAHYMDSPIAKAKSKAGNPRDENEIWGILLSNAQSNDLWSPISDISADGKDIICHDKTFTKTALRDYLRRRNKQ